jgi:hypothetical protein
MSPDRSGQGKAIAALVCAIASFAVCPVVLAIVALVIASKAMYVSSYSANSSRKIVLWARIVAWANIAFSVIGVFVSLSR